MSGWLRLLFNRRGGAAAFGDPPSGSPYEARLAIYREGDTLPQVVALSADDCLSLIDALCKRTLGASQERGGVIPLLALREIVENLLHASFRDVVVSVLADGSVLVSDHGPGIPDKSRAMRPGFTTASPGLRRYIRGVGSGLNVAEESLRAIGGSLRVEDNLGGGTVVSLLIPARTRANDLPPSASWDRPAPASPAGEPMPEASGDSVVLGVSSPPQAKPEGTASHKGEYTKGQTRQRPRVKGGPSAGDAARPGSPLSPRQEGLLRLFAEVSEVGPSTAASGAGLSLASAYRELVALERQGLLEPLPGGKRRLSARGEEVLAALRKR